MSVSFIDHSWDQTHYVSIVTKDYLMTETVRVSLFKPDGELLEYSEGNVEKSYGAYEFPLDPSKVIPGTRVQISITDIPGRTTTKIFTFSSQSSDSSKSCLRLV